MRTVIEIGQNEVSLVFSVVTENHSCSVILSVLSKPYVMDGKGGTIFF